MSTRRFPIGVAALVSAMLLASHVSAAEPAANTRLQAWTVGQQLALCHLGGDKKRLKIALLADPMTGAFEQWAAQRDLTCQSAAVRPRGDFYRYAISEAIFRRDLKKVYLRDLAAIGPLTHARPPLKFAIQTSKQDREAAAALQAGAVNLSVLGECVVRSDPMTAHALLNTRPTTEAETAALTKLMPSVEHCVDQSRATKMGIDDLRGAIALNYVRLANAPRNQRAGAAQ